MRDITLVMGQSVHILKRARELAGITQAELARRAGTRQSAISAYETGHREPSVAMLERRLRATGRELSLVLRPARDRKRALPDTPMGRRTADHRGQVLAAVAAHGGRNPRVFGSVARGEDDGQSDVDLLVDLDRPATFFTLGRIAMDVAKILDREVDVVPASALKTDYLEEVLRDAVPV